MAFLADSSDDFAIQYADCIPRATLHSPTEGHYAAFMLIGGPCVIFAPFILVLYVLAMPLWPLAIGAVGLLWCVVWLLERVWSAFGSKAMDGRAGTVAYWFVVCAKPWYYFDPPDVRAARRARYAGKKADLHT